MLCTLPPLMSYSLVLSSTMMSYTVHSPTNSLAQPTCILVYIECNPAPGGSPFELSLGLRSNSRVLSSPPSQSPLVWWFVLGLPWVASLCIENWLVLWHGFSGSLLGCQLERSQEAFSQCNCLTSALDLSECKCSTCGLQHLN